MIHLSSGTMPYMVCEKNTFLLITIKESEPSSVRGNYFPFHQPKFLILTPTCLLWASLVRLPLQPQLILSRLSLIPVIKYTFRSPGASKIFGKYCSLFYQCYILKKKADPIWNEGHPFPRDVDYMVADTLESLRPKLTMYASLEQAIESLQKLNKEHQEQIG